jgi:hypothetical protein
MACIHVHVAHRATATSVIMGEILCFSDNSSVHILQPFKSPHVLYRVLVRPTGSSCSDFSDPMAVTVHALVQTRECIHMPRSCAAPKPSSCHCRSCAHYVLQTRYRKRMDDFNDLIYGIACLRRVVLCGILDLGRCQPLAGETMVTVTGIARI